jgi:ComF family protein
MRHRISQLVTGVLDLVFAPTCVACRQVISTSDPERIVCAVCWVRSHPLPVPRCERCWSPLRLSPFGGDGSCPLCPSLRPAIRFVRSIYRLDGPPREMVHSLKYRGWHSAARIIGERMASMDLPGEVEREVGMVVPVPLTSARWRQRGYNQAALLATRIAEIRGWSIHDSALSRSRSRTSQTTLHPEERRANVAGAFTAQHGAAERLAGRHILLVDDVWTTGATSLACADALLAAGARAVSVLTFARALPDLERQQRRAELLRVPTSY